jgi:hypothetical protein
MDPEYVQSVLALNNLSNTTRILVLTDHQDEQSLMRLEQYFENRTHVSNGSVVEDMLADLFMGTRVSTMNVIIAQLRVSMGKDPLTNYVYVSPRDGGGWDVCGDCIFGCDPRVYRIVATTSW